MTIVEAILLGLLQGLTEFLPVSSSGHLTVAQRLFGLEEVPLLFNVFLHLATLIAVVIFFHKQIIDLLLVLYRWIFKKSAQSSNEQQGLFLHANYLLEERAKRQMIIALILATIVTGIMGLGISTILPDLPIEFVYIGFLVTASILILSSRLAPKVNKDERQLSYVTPKQGLLIGFVQGIGVFPGISRSGITISGGIIAGLNRNVAGEFSFLLSIPAILGAFLLEVKDLDGVTSTIGLMPVFIGCLAAFVSGFFALSFLMKLIKKGKLEYFAYYLIPLAIVGLVFFN